MFLFLKQPNTFVNALLMSMFVLVWYEEFALEFPVFEVCFLYMQSLASVGEHPLTLSCNSSPISPFTIGLRSVVSGSFNTPFLSYSWLRCFVYCKSPFSSSIGLPASSVASLDGKDPYLVWLVDSQSQSILLYLQFQLFLLSYQQQRWMWRHAIDSCLSWSKLTICSIHFCVWNYPLSLLTIFSILISVNPGVWPAPIELVLTSVGGTDLIMRLTNGVCELSTGSKVTLPTDVVLLPLIHSAVRFYLFRTTACTPPMVTWFARHWVLQPTIVQWRLLKRLLGLRLWVNSWSLVFRLEFRPHLAPSRYHLHLFGFNKVFNLSLFAYSFSFLGHSNHSLFLIFLHFFIIQPSI